MISQYGQDEAVVALLAGQRGGYFVDVGASDGSTVSNTLLLEKKFGWTGICVEPNPAFFARLEHNRSCVCVPWCLDEVNREADFLFAGTLGGLVGSYHPTVLQMARRAIRERGAGAPELSGTTSVNTRTFLDLFTAFGVPSVIDYLSLDTEGSELRLLRSFPFDKYRFRVLTVEHNWLPARAEIRRLLGVWGYRCVAGLGCDDLYVSDELVGIHVRSSVWRRRLVR